MNLRELLSVSDVVSLHVPLTDETRHMINSGTLGQMKPGAVLINAARGGVVDEHALAAALRAGHLAGAALDTFETEPLSASAAGHFRWYSKPRSDAAHRGRHRRQQPPRQRDDSRHRSRSAQSLNWFYRLPGKGPAEIAAGKLQGRLPVGRSPDMVRKTGEAGGCQATRH